MFPNWITLIVSFVAVFVSTTCFLVMRRERARANALLAQINSTEEPEPPQNVQVVYADGTRVPVDCAYVGTKPAIHQWVAVAPLRPGVVREVTCDMLPAHTAIGLQQHTEEDHG